MTQYLEQVAQHKIVMDDAQIKVIDQLQQALERLQKGNWRPSFMKNQRGIFLWGNVGVGKSWLMNQFYKMAPQKNKRRYHYHEFMEMIHRRMVKHKSQVNPLMRIADEISRDAPLLCIDEIHVNEITDAMLLYGILQGIFKKGVMLVTTSNYSPDTLYEDGYHQDMFLPAIKLLKKYTEVVEIESCIDYRIQNSATSSSRRSKNINDSDLENIFIRLTAGPIWGKDEIIVNCRPLPVIKVADGIVWLDYGVICSNPRATRDYIEIAKMFGAVIISNMDFQTIENRSMAQRFIHFVDELYDHQVMLVLSSFETFVRVYQSEITKVQYARTISRLYEMQGLMVQQGYIPAE
ncbi:MAG: cell division protein ZapE [Chromatiales bacterium]|nr:cell division protein ZapE [Chromatiales bacterium]